MTDAVWTDDDPSQEDWKQAMYKIQQLSGGRSNEGLCIVRTDRDTGQHPFEQYLDFHILDAGMQSTLKQLVPYIDIEIH